jgi:hypothetical protein
MNIPTKLPVQNRSAEGPLPLLENGDHMTQAEFHRRYESYPDDVKFELVGGVVYMASPVHIDHGQFHPALSLALKLYSIQTPGTQLLDNATTILGEDSEPQPDLSLRILPAFGGRSRDTKKHCILGAPELVAEVAHSTRAFDLYEKRRDYEAAGVQEYIVLSLEEPELVWFDFPVQGSIAPDKKGIARSRVFPGLWINIQALLADDGKGLIATVNRGLKSAAHAAFVKKLRAAK